MGGKNKKQKEELSQAEIWDDSALLQSWDEALAEYKMYHSIHARGERVEDVIKAYEAKEQDMTMTVDVAEPQTTSKVVNSEELEDGELEEGEAEEPFESVANGVPEEPSHEQYSSQTVPSQHQAIHGVPAAMANGVKDEPLKNLMMSWYYAGYYTGLYEGRQSVTNSTAT